MGFPTVGTHPCLGASLESRWGGIKIKAIKSLSQSIPGMHSNSSKGTAGVEGRILSQKLQKEDGL